MAAVTFHLPHKTSDQTDLWNEILTQRGDHMKAAPMIRVCVSLCARVAVCLLDE